FAGEKCEVNVDECASNPCPSGTLCEDKINAYRCYCPEGKLGINCQKEIHYDFDIVLQTPSVRMQGEMVDRNALFTLNSTSLSVSLWFRFASADGSGADKNIVSIYGLRTGSRHSAVSQFLVRSRSILAQVSDSISVQAIGNDLMDGLWHHLVVTWNGQKNLEGGGVTGRLTMYLDNVKHKEADGVGSKARLPPFGWLVIGGIYDASTNQIVRSNGIVGRISRLFIVKKELDSAVLINELYSNRRSYVPVGVVHGPVIYQVEHGPLTIDYNSEVETDGCFTQESCRGLYQATNYASVRICPQDQYVTFDRDKNAIWTSPLFDRAVSTTMNRYTGAEELRAGVYGISAAGFDSDGNAVMCTYRLYVK
ncbi:sushi, von Willebrand factor type A, EGF and pentraxin domain-containing protein 1-like, partial [Mizuhopecten yessoensis]|uniref:sushi, von Willebrand factor type A, EGF and pentraxin domain-containing protein 1-like n=1 Tax=Mizuhopecten yessoensis TaxID=6573 RepID=UPI000B459F7A